MKIIAIGDIHGRDFWKKITKENMDADKIIFIGDYLDTHHAISPGKQMANLKHILDFKRKNPKQVILIMGNHDFHYLSSMEEYYSGYNFKYAQMFEEIILEALKEDLLQFVYEQDGYLFSHAGVSRGFCEDNDIKDPMEINKLPLRAFKFHKDDTSHFGDYERQTPIWIRPRALLNNLLPGYHQVVGHTTQPVMDDGEQVSFIDCLETSGQYWSRTYESMPPMRDGTPT